MRIMKQVLHCLPGGRREIAYARKKWEVEVVIGRFPLPWTDDNLREIRKVFPLSLS